MTTTWILSANRGSASLFEREGNSMRRVQDIPHPEGLRQNRETAPTSRAKASVAWARAVTP